MNIESKILENAINALFKNIKEIPKEVYVIATLVFFAEVSIIVFYFHYTGHNAFYNFLLITAYILVTGFFYAIWDFIKNKIKEKEIKRQEQLEKDAKIEHFKDIIYSLPTIEKQFLKKFADEHTNSLNPTGEEIKLLHNINLKYDFIGFAINGHMESTAFIDVKFLKVLEEYFGNKEE